MENLEAFMSEMKTWRESVDKELAETRQELADARAELLRIDDHRKIANAMAGHSFGYNSQNQKYELERFWTRTREDIYYNGNSTQAGVYDYYVNGTAEMRAQQREKAKETYGVDIPDDMNVGYRVMNMLTTPYIEVAGDRKTAKGCWMVFNILCRMNEQGVPEPSVHTQKMTAEFINEDGEWKLWRFREMGGGFHLDVGLDTGDNSKIPEPLGPMPEHMRRPNYVELVEKGPSYMSYNALTPTLYNPKLPEPYERWDPKDSYFEFSSVENCPVE